MTFVLDAVAEYLGRTVVWLAAETAVALIGAVSVVTILRGLDRTAEWKPIAIAAVVGALIAASLVDRFDLPAALSIDIWRNPVPIVWSLGGALVAATIWALWPRREAATS